MRKDYESLALRFHLERRMFPALSKESRKSAHLCAEMYHYQGQREWALHGISEAVEENNRVGDLTAEDRVEQAWTQGVILMTAGRNAEAIPVLKFVVERHYIDFPHVAEATEALILSLARTGHVNEAEAYLKLWNDHAKPDVEQRLVMMNEIAAARARAD